MKKISAFLIIMIAMLMAGVCAHAAEFSVDTTSLPMGEAYKPYSAQITMSGGSNDGYSFEFISGLTNSRYCQRGRFNNGYSDKCRILC